MYKDRQIQKHVQIHRFGLNKNLKAMYRYELQNEGKLIAQIK